ncbi:MULTISPECIES: bifunctional tetrahydrofolate synthase/dihydrofolate synthase [unclassified Halomonas]|uniref:bifunctional tetrahydrofolate synthase/dihydrofolate synthase n=1 Tax=unclassified Halomonas TaxID=2609666 RepID=UPI0006D96C89|nr:MULTISPECIES: bifunctional tetrahydrofolate synthase/dihydrofolate synthase [unclassified Halomonas]KPQ26688.1 MAG: bifunctional dihydrofolate synthase / folylpolyglutamate synthase FolC [Halomonas sp. HL-93]SBR48418.1 dihydrofolate synthase / folylpolyglutamate synthase [Halomonas sp. HL-93]SNY96289.1 dihydrofolate synthase / folylpolyglutamate synthase [Halomonas sp. hl-4]
MSKTLAQWLDYLETLHPVGIELGLARVSQVAERMGLLNRPIAKRVISVAGTNGKGSTLAMIDSVARAHGQRVGTYTSPHLLHYNERVQLNGCMADDDQLVAGFEAVEQARLAPPAISLTYFEAGTLCALWCLVQQPLDLAVLEVGLGGRLDAVNIVDADVAIVTTIAQDHASFLGTDIAQIGREKAGIFRSGRPAVLGSRELPESVLDVAKALQTPVYQLGSHFNQEGEPTARWCWQGCTTDGDPLSLDALPDPGLPLDNAATALQALVLSGLSLAVAPTRGALANLVVPGRMQWRGQWCLDVGHNPHAAAYLAQHLPSVGVGGTQWGVIGMLSDKDADGVIAALSSRISDWVCVSLDGERARHADELAERIAAQGGRVHYCAATPAAGVEWLATRLSPEDRVLATGSFFTVAALLAQPLPQA